MLDFVPNHSAHDCPLAYSDIYMYIRDPDSSHEVDRYNSRGIAYGSDVGHRPWKDVIQWNYFDSKTIETMTKNFVKVLTLADAVRCDVAYLVLNDVFENAWSYELNHYQYSKPEEEFWSVAIKAAREVNKDAIILAESYYEEYSKQLLDLGFDYVYDKPLLDNLLLTTNDVKEFLRSKTNESWDKACHFVENHDEQRIVFKTEGNYKKAMAAGTIGATVGGMIFMNHGQWEGKKNKLDVHLRRATYETDNLEVKNYYKKLNQVLLEPAFRSSNFYYIDNITGDKKDDFISYIKEEGDNHYLVVVNYSDKQGCANVPIYNVKGYRYCLLHEALSDQEYVKTITEVKNGMQICLDAWESQIFQYNY
jgi:hypothetical protein